ncbi:MAG: HTTM domain-containing protein [Actinomycetota bacterium]|nr:HTTM domain-containing protein [Actinomycetota bacterium]
MIQTLRRWAFEPIDTAPIAALRIACGLLVLGWTLSLLPDAQAFLSHTGVTPTAPGGSAGYWTLPIGSPYGILALLAVAAVVLTVGWHTRVVSVLVAVLLVVVQRRSPYMLNSGDQLLRDLALFLALMPAGETWSLDARRRAGRLRSPWGLRLLQLQISILYLFSVTAKLGGPIWQGGGAVGMSLQLGDLQRIVIPQSLDASVTFSAILTYGTLFAEAFLVVGLWIPKTRWYAMAAGLGIHLGIEATLLIGWFSLTILSCYLAFIPADVLRLVVDRVAERWGQTTLYRRLRPPPPPPVRKKQPAARNGRRPASRPAARPASPARRPARRR